MNPPIDLSLIIKPSGPDCNLACDYCYFLSKMEMYPNAKTRMSDATLERLVAGMFEARAGADVSFIWQGGEPTLMTLSFFRKIMKVIDRYRTTGQAVAHSIQTNGVLIDKQRCTFFKTHGFLVGISIDGPQGIHDAYRVDRLGRGTYHMVLRGWELLKKYAVDANVVCTVHRKNEGAGQEVYRHFRDQLEATWMQFIPVVERRESPWSLDERVSSSEGNALRYYTQRGREVSDRSVSADGYGNFLCDVYDEWLASDVGNIHVQTFEAMLGSLFGQHLLCVHAPTCGSALAIEHNGDLYVCDHYVEPAYKLGNINSSSLRSFAQSRAARQFGASKLKELPASCRTCEFKDYCHGGCPKDRFVAVLNGEMDVNYLCASYRKFFSYADGSMRKIFNLVRAGKPAREVMAE